MKNLRKKLSYALYFLLVAFLLTSCSQEKEGMIVKDNKGNYYKLSHDSALGNERYMLIEIDTTIVKPVGF